jgi:23S rRNA pseudouridine1911/1915/1917 synthase
MSRRTKAMADPTAVASGSLLDQQAPNLAGDALTDADLVIDDEGDLVDEALPAPMPPAPVERAWLIDANAHGQRLDVVLVSGAGEYSRSHLKHLIEEGCVTLDGSEVRTPSRKVSAGQQVRVQLKPTAQSLAFVPEPMALPIVFEDEHLIVVNKPAGLVVHPAAGNWTGTLMNGLLAHHAGAVDLPRAGIVHRLDKDTSGLMVVGKTLPAVTALARAIAAREVSRQYLSLVHGVVPDAFTVEAPIGRDPSTRVRMAIVAGGKPARTDVQRLISARWQAVPAQGKAAALKLAPSFSGVLCTLHSGRTHQIRVHLSSRKHPLVADAVYGGTPALGLTRQALHAARLAFTHPITGAPLRFEAPLPDDMAHAWSLLEQGEAA